MDDLGDPPFQETSGISQLFGVDDLDQYLAIFGLTK